MKYILALTSILIVACGGTKKTDQYSEVDMIEPMHKISLYKGACFGRCPSYEFEINRNGIMQFRSIRFTQKEGIYTKKLDESVCAKIFDYIDDINYMAFETEYPSNIPDMPLIRIKYYFNGKIKKVQGKMERPEEIKTLQKMLEELAESTDRWTEVEEDEYDKHYNLKDTQLIVSFTKDTLVPRWIKNYKAYGLQIIQQMAANQNVYMLKFDPETTSAKSLKAILDNDAAVNEVVFRK